MLFLNIICAIWLIISIINIIECMVLTIEISNELKAMGWHRTTKATFFEKVIGWISTTIKASIPLYHLFLLIGLLFLYEQSKAMSIEKIKNNPIWKQIN